MNNKGVNKMSNNDNPISTKLLVIAFAIATGFFFFLNGMLADGKPKLDEEAAIIYHYKGTGVVSTADYNSIKNYVNNSLTRQNLAVVSADNGTVTITYSLYTAETLPGLKNPSLYDPGVLTADVRYGLISAMTIVGPAGLWMLIIIGSSNASKERGSNDEKAS